MSTSAFTCPTSWPSRSTLTARRLPDICVDRFITGAGTLARGGGATGAGATARPATRSVRGVRAGAGAAGARSGRSAAVGGVAATAGDGERRRRVAAASPLPPRCPAVRTSTGTRRQLLLQHLDALRHAGHALLDLREDLLFLLERQRVERLAIGHELLEQLTPDQTQIDADALGILRVVDLPGGGSPAPRASGGGRKRRRARRRSRGPFGGPGRRQARPVAADARRVRLGRRAGRGRRRTGRRRRDERPALGTPRHAAVRRRAEPARPVRMPRTSMLLISSAQLTELQIELRHLRLHDRRRRRRCAAPAERGAGAGLGTSAAACAAARFRRGLASPPAAAAPSASRRAD